MGLFTMFIYFVNLNVILTHVLNLNTQFTIIQLIHLALYCGTIGAFAIFLVTAPTLIIKLLLHDPTKKKLIAELYNPKTKYDKFLKNRAIILEADNSERTFTLIEMAMSLHITRFNLNYIKKDLLTQYSQYFNQYIKEIDNLQNQISQAILKNQDKGMILNLNELRRVSEEIDKIESKSPEFLNIKKTIHQYLKIFTKLNLVLTGALVKEKIPLPKENDETEWSFIKNNFTIDNINVRYCIRFAIAINLSFIFDIISGGIIQYAATISSFFTMKPDAKFTKITVIKRIIATLAGSTLATIIAVPLIQFNLTILIPVCAVISMGLFYAYIQNNYSIGIFFAMMMVVFIQPTNLLISQAFYRIFGTAVGALISLIVGIFILPNVHESNLSSLLADKIRFNKNLIIDILNKNNDARINDQRMIHKTNLHIDSAIDRISEEYVGIEEDIEFIVGLSDSINQIQGNFLSLNRYIFRTNRDFKFEKALNLFDEFFDRLNYVITDNVSLMFDDEFDELEDIVNYLENTYTDNKDIILLRYFKWIYEDMELIYDLVREGEKTNLFNRFNQML